MAASGKTQLKFWERREYFRDTPRETRAHKSEFANKHKSLIISFTRDDYILYEKLAQKYKRTNEMLSVCTRNDVPPHVLTLAQIRNTDGKVHQRIMLLLRYRWTDLHEAKTHELNEDPNKFWSKMSSSIQRRCLAEDLELYPDWQGEAARPTMVEFFDALFKRQEGLCAISKTPMDLKIGIGSKNDHKCSPDRIDSSKGYTPDNIWFVTSWVNSMKMDMTMEQFSERINCLHTSLNKYTIQGHNKGENNVTSLDQLPM
jgi:hypothetical protein